LLAIVIGFATVVSVTRLDPPRSGTTDLTPPSKGVI
jgi:hypothetical protein